MFDHVSMWIFIIIILFMILNNDTSRIWKPGKGNGPDRNKDESNDWYHD